MLALALLLIGGGGFTLYAGMTGQKITPALRDVLGGRKPTAPPSGGSAPAGTGRGVGAAAGAAAGAATGLDPALQQRLGALIAAAPGKVTITSGFRSNQRQQELFDAAVKKYGSEAAARKWVARPGTSNHEKGLAGDLAFSSKAVERWVHANAGRFGLHFPMTWEPWHIELLPGFKNSNAGAGRSQPVTRPRGHQP